MNTLRLLPGVLARNSTRPPIFKVLPKTARALLSTSADKTHLIVNSLGVDRTGIVSDLTKLVTDAGGNVGESHAAKIGNYFSLTMLIAVPTQAAEGLKGSLNKLDGMTTNCIESGSDPNTVTVKPSIGYSGRFLLEGVDDPGLVHKVTTVLARHMLSIDTMETSEEIAPHGGTTLFCIDGIATAPSPLPKSFDVEKIRDELSALGDSLNCDITLEDNISRKQRPNWIWENVA